MLNVEGCPDSEEDVAINDADSDDVNEKLDD